MRQEMLQDNEVINCAASRLVEDEGSLLSRSNGQLQRSRMVCSAKIGKQFGWREGLHQVLNLQDGIGAFALPSQVVSPEASLSLCWKFSEAE